MPNPPDSTIAVVDDDDAFAKLLCDCIRDLGKQAVPFSRGLDFLSRYEPDSVPPPEIVVLDIHLPDMPGTEICSRARALKKFDRTIFIAFTGRMRSDDERWLKNIGFDLVLI